jgi:hypothetical protein
MTTPSRATLWRLAIRDGLIAGQDMAWVRDHYDQLLVKWKVAEGPDYRDERDYLDDDNPSRPFEPGDYLDDRRR